MQTHELAHWHKLTYEWLHSNTRYVYVYAYWGM